MRLLGRIALILGLFISYSPKIYAGGGFPMFVDDAGVADNGGYEVTVSGENEFDIRDPDKHIETDIEIQRGFEVAGHGLGISIFVPLIALDTADGQTATGLANMGFAGKFVLTEQSDDKPMIPSSAVRCEVFFNPSKSKANPDETDWECALDMEYAFGKNKSWGVGAEASYDLVDKDFVGQNYGIVLSHLLNGTVRVGRRHLKNTVYLPLEWIAEVQATGDQNAKNFVEWFDIGFRTQYRDVLFGVSVGTPFASQNPDVDPGSAIRAQAGFTIEGSPIEIYEKAVNCFLGLISANHIQPKYTVAPDDNDPAGHADGGDAAPPKAPAAPAPQAPAPAPENPAPGQGAAPNNSSDQKLSSNPVVRFFQKHSFLGYQKNPPQPDGGGDGNKDEAGQ